MDFLLIFEKGFFAAIAALGFAAVGNPSKAAFRYVPIIAFCGNALRFSLMTYAGMNIAIATFFAAVFAGFIAVGFAYHTSQPSRRGWRRPDRIYVIRSRACRQ